ncbi:MAG: transglycosylase SLT domain-containing protein [Cardiobacteriaceae bacterium]|nr:transglycosylase SLT domain-containing protein [Cardiobacteriaceae bacterium]
MLKKLILSAICLATFGHAHGNTHMLAAEEAIKGGAPLALYQNLRGHPLYPWLQYHDYKNRLPLVPAEELAEFMHNHPYAPFSGLLADQLFPQWLGQGNYRAIIRAYQPGYANQAAQCRYRLAELYSGNRDKALADLETLWEGDKIPEAACADLLAQLPSRGDPREIVRNRFTRAMAGNNRQIASNLLRHLQGDALIAARSWLAIDSGAEPLASALTLGDSAWRAAVLGDQIDKKARKQTETAAQAAFAALANGHFKGENKAAGRAFNRLTRILADANDPRTLQAWQGIPAGEHEKTTIEQLIAYAQRIHAWHQLPGWLAQHLGEKDLKSAEVQYWIGKALEKSGNSAAAQTHYRNAARERDIYGFIAAEKLGLPYAMNDRPIRKDPALYGKVLSRPNAYRIKIFHHIGLASRARQEWQYFIKDLNPDEIGQAALFADQLQWPILAITTLASVKNWDALALRFPVRHEAAVRQLAARHGISPATILAIIRKESIFQTDIRSPVGAVGLMQVMPATARATATRAGIPYGGEYQLTHIDTNLAIGSQYLADRLDQYGHLAYAAAAYNAGPARATRWMNERPGIPLDEWIAQIPFNETRDYVKRVIEFEKVYEYRLGLPHRPIHSPAHPAW